MSTVRIVLADDHAVVRAGIANALRELSDLEIVAELGDGSALLSTLERVRPDVLVTDVTMPDFEPVGAIRQIRARFPDLKILIVSAYDDDVYVQGLLGAGVNGYHLKDQPLGDLVPAILRRGQADRETIGMVARDDAFDAPDVEAQAFEATEFLRCVHLDMFERPHAPAHRLMQGTGLHRLRAGGMSRGAMELHAHRADAAMREHGLATRRLGDDDIAKQRAKGRLIRAGQKTGSQKLLGLFLAHHIRQKRASG